MIKLQQNQVWRQGERYLRIVQLERMTVDYKLMQDPVKKEGSHHHTTKKEFCRLLKGATLMSRDEMQALAAAAPAPPESETPDESVEAGAQDAEFS